MTADGKTAATSGADTPTTKVGDTSETTSDEISEDQDHGKKQSKRPELIDPIAERPRHNNTESRIAIFGHPIHAMSVAFPVALTFCGFGADVIYWFTGDVFWARAALWAIGTGFILGMFSGFSGTAEILFVPGIRARAPAWTHFIIAVAALAIMGTNWGHRISDYEAAVLPYGIMLSGLGVLIVMVTGWHGGKLVFDYKLGVSKGNSASRGS